MNGMAKKVGAKVPGTFAPIEPKEPDDIIKGMP